MRYTYRTHGVCSRFIHLEIEDGVLRDVQIEGGCDGNGKGLVALAVGRDAREVCKLLAGIRCEQRPTSCPDQLSAAIRQALQQTPVNSRANN